MFAYEIDSSSSAMTQRIGLLLGHHLIAGDCIPLIGSIGVGKTCLVQGIAQGLHVPQHIPVTSPSFTLINRYPGDLVIFHVDFYRLEGARDLDDLEFEEILGENGVVIVEWPEIVLPQIRSGSLIIYIHWDMQQPNHRRLVFKSETNRFNAFFQELNHAFPGH